MGSKKKTKGVYDSEAGYDAYSANYDKKSGLLDTFDDGEFLQMLGNVRGKKILNIGCGTGRDTAKLLNKDAEIICMDVSEGMLEVHKKKFPSIKTVRGSSDALPFEDDSFDIVFMSFLIVHLKNLRESFNEAYRVLKTEGMLVLNNINQRKAPNVDVGNRELIKIHSYYHRPQNVINALEEAFLKIEDEKFIYYRKTWINQIVKARKL
ncbi:methyltransferase domain-containing protein [Candidatus Peregrinibacteria bacterium]|nr:methyltransferase domain-containing protein [Candidatus Peregrinibacteria bacterium]